MEGGGNKRDGKDKVTEKMKRKGSQERKEGIGRKVKREGKVREGRGGKGEEAKGEEGRDGKEIKVKEIGGK